MEEEDANMDTDVEQELDYDIYMEQEANEHGEQGANKGDTDVHVEQGVDEQESIVRYSSIIVMFSDK